MRVINTAIGGLNITKSSSVGESQMPIRQYSYDATYFFL